MLDLSGLNKNVIRTGAESGRVEFLDPAGLVTSTLEFSEIERVICFTPGTGIATPRGTVAVESLGPGDKVITRDNGIREIAWVGARDLSILDQQRTPSLRPVLICEGALGAGMPEYDIWVSPNHRMLLTNQFAEMLFGEREVLVAAKHLTGLSGVSLPTSKAKASYAHIMFENHEVVLAGGTWSESFQPGVEAMRGVESAQRRELMTLFPELVTAQGIGAYRAARRSLKSYEAKLLVTEANL